MNRDNVRQKRAEAIEMAKKAGIIDHKWLEDQYDAIERLVYLAAQAAYERAEQVCYERRNTASDVSDEHVLGQKFMANALGKHFRALANESPDK